MIAPVSQTPMMPDSHLEYWCERYVESGLYYRDVPLLAFLAEPSRYLDHLVEDNTAEHLPLLPAQLEVQTRLDAEAAAAEEAAVRECPAAECRGNVLIEPLHHHTHPVRSARAMFRRQGGDS